MDASPEPKQITLCTCLREQVTYVFVESCEARTLLGTVTRLFIPASKHLLVIYSGQIRRWLEKSAGDLEHPYSDRWEPSNRLDQSQGSKLANIHRPQTTDHKPQTDKSTLWKSGFSSSPAWIAAEFKSMDFYPSSAAYLLGVVIMQKSYKLNMWRP